MRFLCAIFRALRCRRAIRHHVRRPAPRKRGASCETPRTTSSAGPQRPIRQATAPPRSAGRTLLQSRSSIPRLVYLRPALLAERTGKANRSTPARAWRSLSSSLLRTLFRRIPRLRLQATTPPAHVRGRGAAPSLRPYSVLTFVRPFSYTLCEHPLTIHQRLAAFNGRPSCCRNLTPRLPLSF